jgi:uncharacterized protein (DUF488 family)
MRARPVKRNQRGVDIFTVGHSTRSLDELVELLRENRVQTVVDVRRIPASRRMPHFSAGSLTRELPVRGIAYVHMPALGGLRRPRPDSANDAWRNPSFRGYADYMAEPEFSAAVDELMELSSESTLALMCAEAVPWRCHRSLLSDALTLKGVKARHILGTGNTQAHRLTPFAKIEGDRLTYPAPQTSLPF